MSINLTRADIEMAFGAEPGAEPDQHGTMVVCATPGTMQGKGAAGMWAADARIYGDGIARRVDILKVEFYREMELTLVDYPVNRPFVINQNGLGLRVCKAMEDKGAAVNRVDTGLPCFHAKNRDRYANLRAQAVHQAACAAKEGRLSIPTNDYRDAIIAGAQNFQLEYDVAGLLRARSAFFRDSGPWAAICLAFAEGVG